MDKKMLVLFLFALFSSFAYSQPTGTQGSYPLNTDVSAFYAWLPVLMLAVIVAIGITLAYYAIASLLGNSRLKAAALGEFSQVIGTIIVLVIILALFNIYGGIIYSGDSSLATSVSNICSQLKGSPFNFTNSNISGPTSAVCSQIINGGATSTTSGSRDPTTNIDYGLGATYVIIANLTNQTSFSLNVLNVFENYFYTLAGIVPTESICWPSLTCSAVPTAGTSITYSYEPFFFYGKIRGGTIFVNTEAQVSMYIGIVEMLVIILLMFGWPYILAAGLILKATFFTRRAGGLMIAIVVVGMFLFPFLNLFEYSALTNVNSPVNAIGIDANAIPYLAVNGLATSTNTNIVYNTHTINFYVFPRLDYILNYYGCWPPNGSVLQGVAQVAGYYSVPGVGLALALSDFIGALLGNLPSSLAYAGFGCTPPNMLQSWLALSNFYGQAFVFSLLLPVLNILMLLSAVKGISSLLGGDTSLLGLSRLL